MPGSRIHDARLGAIPAVAVVVSRYNSSITERLLEAAMDEYVERGGERDAIVVLHAPGAYELPALALAAARSGRIRGVAALGCLIRGETRHDRYIASAVANGLIAVTIATGVPVTFGVLTVDGPGQAQARAGGKKGNKGADAMAALLDTITVADALARAADAGDLSLADRQIASRPDKAATAERG